LEARSFGGDPESAATVLEAVERYQPDGIVCDNDRHAAIMMRHLLNAKIDIPKQIKLAGFDDTPTASLLTVPLTTIRQPAGAIALRAMSVMNDRIADPHLPPVHVAVHCELVVRESTVSTSDPVGKVFAARDVRPRLDGESDRSADDATKPPK
jgi:GntR family transcriptional regulator of arabinose operon